MKPSLFSRFAALVSCIALLELPLCAQTSVPIAKDNVTLTAPIYCVPGAGIDPNNKAQVVSVGTTGRLVSASGSDASYSVVASAAYEASHVVSATACTLHRLHVYNSDTGAGFIQIFNAATLPADTAVPLFTAAIATVANGDYDFGSAGLPLSTGCVVVYSSTGPTKTIASAKLFITAVIR